jgi:transcriptional regulator with XRE-family HTH domain
MDIGTRLRELREAKSFSQGDIEKRTRLLRCYVSRVECGHTVPNLETLEKWAKALDLELYQLFFHGKGKPVAPKVADPRPRNTREMALLRLFQPMPEQDKQLFVGLAREAFRIRKRNE